MMTPNLSNPTRRRLIQTAGAAAGFLIVPRHVLGGPSPKAPSDTLNIAGVGVGGMGASYLENVASQNIAVLCDVDWSYAAPTFRKYPQARQYRDYREMLDKEKGVDAVVIGTPDHTHAAVALAAMELGKHVYCAKPLTRTLAEARAVARRANETGVATQMSVQTCRSDNACRTAEWVQSGEIGAVREVHVWSDRPIWPQALPRPGNTPAMPSGLDWSLWLGPAPFRPYHPAYHPWVWRGWYDFGTGALGDMGCHSLHVIVTALDLGAPGSVEASSARVVRGYREHDQGERLARPEILKLEETFPHASIVTWNFPARGNAPAVRLTWYDGGLRPPPPPDLEPNRQLGRDGILFVGDKGTILSGFSGGPKLLPEKRNKHFTPPKPHIERTPGHYEEWIAAGKGGPKPTCEFDFGSRLTEITLLGDLAVRSGAPLEWDAKAGRVTNLPEVNRWIDPPARQGW